MKLLFIDSLVTAPETLLNGLLPDIQAIILDVHQNGIAQISSVLQENPQIQTLHIVSHGSPGCLYLGNGELNLTNIYQYQELLQHWNVKNIVLYGCNVAAGDAGEEFIRKFHDITKAQITATATKTGNPKLGGNWHLEVSFPKKTDLAPPVGAKHTGDNISQKYDNLSIRMLRPLSTTDDNINPKYDNLPIRMLRPLSTTDDNINPKYNNLSIRMLRPPSTKGDKISQKYDNLSIRMLRPPSTKGKAFGIPKLSYFLNGPRPNALPLQDLATENQTLAFTAETLATYQGVFAPTLVGKWDYLSNAVNITIVGNYAYAVGDTLEIIDITNPSNPIFKGNYDISSGQDIQVVGNYAYVADWDLGLKIIDISNPTNPQLKGTYATSGNANAVQVVGNLAYVADFTSGLQIIDITNPLNPQLKGTYDTSGYALAVQVVGNYAYVADYTSGLQIIDISNPLNPQLKGTYDTPDSARSVQVVGNLAYVADEGSGLQIIDISNPLNPQRAGSYDTSGGANAVQVVSNLAYVADYTSGLAIIDITNPLNPLLKSTYDPSGSAGSVQVVGNYAYVADYTSGLQIIDISNPLNPQRAGSYDTSGLAFDAQVVGNYAYVADSNSGLQIIDISNPLNPQLKGTYDTSGYARSVQVVGNLAYVADFTSGLQIIDITNPLNPQLKGTYDTSGWAKAVQVVGNLAYVADGDSGLAIIDITNPLNPQLKGTYTSGWAKAVQVVGNLAYVADGISGLAIIDISNPVNPQLKGSYDTPSYASAVQVLDNLAYVADGDSGTQIIDISEPLNPTLKDTYDTDGKAWGVQVVDNSAYVGDYNGGLKIVNVSEFTNTGGNQAPSNITLSNSNINENFAVGTLVGNLTTTDPNTGNTFTYSLVTGTGSTDNALFSITGNQLTNNAVFDYETKNSYSIRVRTTDQGGLSFEKAFTITVTNANTTPTNLTLSNSNIAENQVIGTVIGNLSTTDPDAGNTFTYSLVTGTGSTDNALFSITGNQLTNNAVFDYETKNSYSIRVRTTDQGELSFEKAFTITVTNVNETPTNLTLSNSNIAENQVIGTVIGNLSTTDPDAGNTFTYSLVTGTGSTDNASFSIVGNQLKTKAIFNFETKNNYSIRLRTTDQGGLFYEKQLTIAVNNVNETPTNLTLSNSNIAENQVIGTVVGNLSTTDVDSGNTFTYTLVTGTGSTDNASFTIVGNQLQTNGVFNFETKKAYSVRVRTTDQGGLFFEKVLPIAVTNVNESPTNITLSATTVAENLAIGTLVGNLTSTDPDASNTFTYSLVTGTGSTDNASFSVVGTQLKTNAIFNFENKSSYSILLRTTDQGGLYFDKAFTIAVTNVNETPTNLTLSNNIIDENKAINTVIGTLTTTDPDVSNTFTYSLVAGTGSTDNALFSITGNQLKNNAVFDFETKNSYSIRVRTTDQGGLFVEKQLTIN
jgi:hypothetical protein